MAREPWAKPSAIQKIGCQLVTVEKEKDFERGVTDPLVAVDEGMVADERVCDRCGLVGERRVQVDAVERGTRLGESRLQAAEFPQTRRAAGLGDDAFMEDEHFGERSVAHGAPPLS